MICNKCGNEVENNTKFCINCGNNLETMNTLNLNQNVGNVNNVGNVQYNTQLSHNIQQANNHNPKSKNGLAIASLIIGIISMVLSIFINIFIFPLAITGLVLGIVNKNKCGQKIAGIILNSLSMVVAIIILFAASFLVVSELSDFYNEEDYPTAKDNVSGIWNCKSFDGLGPGDEYIITMKLNYDGSFSWSKYNDELNNHVYGIYTYEDEKKTNNSGDYKYYMVNLDGHEFVNNGILQTEEYNSTYEMGINFDYGEAILMNISTYNMYYCYLEY